MKVTSQRTVQSDEYSVETDIDDIIELTADEGGQRIDSFIAERTQLSRSFVKRVIVEGNVLLNTKPCKASSTVAIGDVVTIILPPVKATELVAENIPIDIVYQDADIAVINKQVGMVVHPAAGNEHGTLVNAIMYHIKDLSGIGGEQRPGIVHRIDKNTSGLLVIAKNDFAHTFLANELKTHNVKRTYLALCSGNFPNDEGTVNAPIGRDRRERKRMCVDRSGRDAITHYRVLERYGEITLLEVKLETGRTHQIRVHMSYINHPIIGDDVYSSGRNNLGFKGQALHAYKLELVHPRTKQRMEFEAMPPEHYIKAIQKLRQSKR